MKTILRHLMTIPDIITNILVNKIVTRQELNSIIKISGKETRPEGIKEWVNKWSVLGTPNKDYYRVFSQYIGPSIDIVPDNICHNIIIPILNPKRYISTYADKNLFDKFIRRKDGTTLTPYTLLRCVRGTLFDRDYELVETDNLEKTLSNETSIIVKPSIDGSSGKGVLFFDKIQNNWIERNSGDQLSIPILSEKIGSDFIVQRALRQSPFMSNLCNTSVNTIRMVVYRSVKDNKCHALRAIIRIGKDGSLVDNAHAGGMFVGIDNNGKLGKYCCDQFGQTSTIFNNIDFNQRDIYVPNYTKIKEFAEEIGSYITHLRLLALDIMIDENDRPILIEYNVKAFSPWLFQFTCGTAFGRYTDEIIDYCNRHRKEATRFFISF